MSSWLTGTNRTAKAAIFGYCGSCEDPLCPTALTVAALPIPKENGSTSRALELSDWNFISEVMDSKIPSGHCGNRGKSVRI